MAIQFSYFFFLVVLKTAGVNRSVRISPYTPRGGNIPPAVGGAGSCPRGGRGNVPYLREIVEGIFGNLAVSKETRRDRGGIRGRPCGNALRV